MFQQVRKTFFQSFQIFFGHVCFRHAAVVFQSFDRSYDDNCVWLKFSKTAFDIQEFLSTQVSAETSLCYYIIAKVHSHLCSNYRVTAVCDVRERTAVDKAGSPFQSLNKVWFQSVFQKCHHSALCVQLSCCDRLVLP